MSADRISATGRVVLKSVSVEKNSSTGAHSTRIYTGSYLDMILQSQVEAGFGANMLKLESTGDGNYQLTSGFGFDLIQGSQSEAPTNLHELENSMSQVNVLNNPNFRAGFIASFGSVASANAAIADLVGKVSAFKAANDGSTTAQAAAEAEITSAYSGGQATLMLNAFRGMAYHQIENTIQFDTIYRRRITAASFNQVQTGFTGIGKIWTTAEVLAFENVPAAWWFQLPTDYLWLKAAPIVSTVAGQKTEISYNYLAVAEAWGLLYQAYGSATLLNF